MGRRRKGGGGGWEGGGREEVGGRVGGRRWVGEMERRSEEGRGGKKGGKEEGRGQLHVKWRELVGTCAYRGVKKQGIMVRSQKILH